MPSIPIECLEFDRIHRASTCLLPDGPPCDIIVKLHFYHTKEQLLSAAHSKDSLQFHGHAYQIFSNLAPLTMTKRKAMKPQLQILLQHQLRYTWHFPFALQFTYQGQQHSCTSPELLQHLLETLHLVASDPEFETTLPRTPAHPAPHPYHATPMRASPGPSSICKGTPVRSTTLGPKNPTSTRLGLVDTMEHCFLIYLLRLCF